MQALVYAPQHQFSYASPDKPWSQGNLTILTDADVDAWLTKHAPPEARAAVKEIKREAQIIKEAQAAETSYIHTGLNGSAASHDGVDIGTPLMLLQDPPKHWAFALYPGCGSVEICALVAPLLTQREHAALVMQFAEGKSGKEMSAALGMCNALIFRLLKSARVKLYQAAKADLLPPRPDPAFFTNTVSSLDELRQMIECGPVSRANSSYRVNNYHANRPKGRAYVCDCGHHLTLTNADLDHRKVVPGLEPAKDGKPTRSKLIPERQFRCRFCGRTYPESQWHKILC